jgi:Immunoglobulin I-set domain
MFAKDFCNNILTCTFFWCTVPSTIDRSRVNSSPSVIVNHARVLDCPVVGVPPPVITWFKDGLPLVPAEMTHVRLRMDGRKLELLSTTVADAGVYECRAENEAGTDSVRYELKVFGVQHYVIHWYFE